MPVSFSELMDAFEFVNFGGAGGYGGHRAFLCKRSGKIYWHFEDPELDELPDGVEDIEQIEEDDGYLAIPDKRELDLGTPLVMDFVQEALPGDFDEVRRIFSRRGAYTRFKSLLARRNTFDQWYDFQNRATERALREWCEINSIELND